MKIFRKAILVVHGFAGGVYDQEYLTHELELISNYDVYTFTLPGHDGDFKSKITYEDWINKAESEMEFLINHGYNNIYVIGHSMGGVIAAHLASKYNQVKKLVLVAPAFRIFGFEDGKYHIETSVTKIQKIYEQYGMSLVTNRLLKLPPNCYLEFMRLIDKYKDVSKINIPVFLIRGLSDNIVPEESVQYVYDNVASTRKRIIHLKNTTHDVFREEKKVKATKYIIEFFNTPISLDLFEDEK